MKISKTVGVILTLTGLFMALAPLTALGTPAVDHCIDHNVPPNIKDESGADDNDFVPSAGDVICVKASTENTGQIVADGETTLQEYLFEAGIVDGSGEQGRDVSYWVLYPPTTTTTTQPEETTTTVPEVTTTVPEVTTTVPEVTTTVPEVTTVPEITTVPEVTTVLPTTKTTESPAELPFTGPENMVPLVLLGTMLAGSGLGLLVKSRKLEEENL